LLGCGIFYVTVAFLLSLNRGMMRSVEAKCCDKEWQPLALTQIAILILRLAVIL